jgi:hypothetical protein
VPIEIVSVDATNLIRRGFFYRKSKMKTEKDLVSLFSSRT